MGACNATHPLIWGARMTTIMAILSLSGQFLGKDFFSYKSEISKIINPFSLDFGWFIYEIG